MSTANFHFSAEPEPHRVRTLQILKQYLDTDGDLIGDNTGIFTPDSGDMSDLLNQMKMRNQMTRKNQLNKQKLLLLDSKCMGTLHRLKHKY
jgi:hypothetical protein